MKDMLIKVIIKFIHFTNDIKIRSKILILVYSSIIFFVMAISFFTFKKVEGIVNQESSNSMIGILNQSKVLLMSGIICMKVLQKIWGGNCRYFPLFTFPTRYFYQMTCPDTFSVQKVK